MSLRRNTFITIAVLTFSLMLVLCFLTGCSGSSSESRDPVLPAEENTSDENERMTGKSVVAEIFPVYDWLLNIIGDNPGDLEVSLLIGNGTDMHSFQPSISDIMKVSSCDLLVYTGGESDEWVSDAAAGAVNKEMTVVNLMDELEEVLLEEEDLPGMEKDPGEKTAEVNEAPAEDQDPEESAGTQEEEEACDVEYDEHVWLSLKNACILCQSLADALMRIDPANADSYRENAADYIEKLQELDQRFEQTVNSSQIRTLLFADRFPFLYLTRDYGLEYFAAFQGCSAETEASFGTIIFLAEKADELLLEHIMVIDGSDKKLAETIINSTDSKDQDILIMDSMQSIDQKMIENGTTYLEIMEKNLETLKEALCAGEDQ